MKRVFFLFLFAIFTLTAASAQSASQQKVVELSFSYTHLSGSASNQFAVWIEDSKGNYVKTLYATRYTANGGWKVRESSIPVWVKKSNLSGMSKKEVDVLTSATPKTGSLTYVWDGTDSKGTKAAAGEYVIFLEGTLRWDNQVLYRSQINLGRGAATPEVIVKYTGDAGNDRKMIDDVKVKVFN